MRVKVGFIGFSEAGTERVISVIEAASNAILEAAVLKGPAGGIGKITESFDGIFIAGNLDNSEIEVWLKPIREQFPGLPVVLTYQSQPGGRAFLLASRFDCWLFGENDDTGRTLSAAELGEALGRSAAQKTVEHHLMEVALSAGPCSTGS